ncbi:MAG: hypothetical protein DIU76_05545 [Bacillota bacterium]|nr:MAG: hypothetical protein DIU76_05545 [Bacillota bacterium]
MDGVVANVRRRKAVDRLVALATGQPAASEAAAGQGAATAGARAEAGAASGVAPVQAGDDVQGDAAGPTAAEAAH